jgi:tetratricopeptide (TPR) repeat protein
MLLADGQADPAATAFQRALDISRGLAQAAPADRGRRMGLGQSLGWLANAQYLRGRLDLAMGERQAEAAIYQALVAADPSDNDARLALAIARTAMARILLTEGHAAAALGALGPIQTDIDRILASAPGDQSYKLATAPCLLLAARIALSRGQLDRAEALVTQARAMAEAAARGDPGDFAWSGERLGIARVLAMKISAARAKDRAGQANALTPARAEAARLASLTAERPDNLVLARTAAEADLLAGDAASLGADRAGARAYWRQGMDQLTRAGLPDQPPGDPSGALLRQLDYRLRSERPPYARASRRASHGEIDYRW